MFQISFRTFLGNYSYYAESKDTVSSSSKKGFFFFCFLPIVPAFWYSSLISSSCALKLSKMSFEATSLSDGVKVAYFGVPDGW